ncbi:MAG TPA: hypothetical protein VK427_19195, partial [Kofleriaceae bacterium]|nr:hypothetical protein [Kofleriaceae bacterium]
MLRKISQYLTRWPAALLVTVLLAGAILLPALGRPGLWEPGERQLSDRVAPPVAIQQQLDDQRAKVKALQASQPKPAEPTCRRAPPDDALARSLTNRAMTWGRDNIADTDGGRKLPLALLGVLTVIATAGIAMRGGRARAGVIAGIVVLSMPLLVLQSRMLTSDIGTACGASLIIYGFLA